MAPPEALVGGVRVEGGVGVEVVVAVAAGPLDGVALHRQAAAVRQGVLQPLGRLEAPVAQLPVVGQGDAQAPWMQAV